MKPRQRTCRRASGMTTCSAPMPAFGRTACGRNAGRSSMIPSCIAIASELSTHMSRSGRDINGAARDYPTRQSGRANLRRDNQRRRRWDPRPSNWGPPARHKEPTRHSSAAPYAAEPIRLSVRGDGRGAGCQPLVPACQPELLPPPTCTTPGAGPVLAGPFLEPSETAWAAARTLYWPAGLVCSKCAGQEVDFVMSRTKR